MTMRKTSANVAAMAFACCMFMFAAPVHAAAPTLDRAASARSSDVVLVHDDRRDRWNYKDRDRKRYNDRNRYRDRHYEPYRWDYDHKKHWRSDRHPRRPYWQGRPLPRHGRFLVITDYWNYHLPPPPHGHYYVRVDNDVFLVMEVTRTIIDAFILFELLNR